MADAGQAPGFFHLVADHWETILGLGGAVCGSVAFLWYTLKRTIPDLIEKINGLDIKHVESVKMIREDLERIRNEQVSLDRRAMELGYAKKREFYDDKGMPLFQMRSDCLSMRGDCSVERAELKHSLCKKMEEVKHQLATDVRTIHESLNEQSEEAATQAEKIKDVLDRVERIVEKDRQVERREEMLEMVEALGDKLAESIIGKIKDTTKVNGGR